MSGKNIHNLPFKAIASALEKGKVFLTRDASSRFEPDEDVTFRANIRIEPYAALLAGNQLYSCGAFSYAWSALTAFTTVGRYCSIAHGVRIREENTFDNLCFLSEVFRKPTFLTEHFHTDQNTSFSPKTHTPQEVILIGHVVWIAKDVTLARLITI